MTQNLPEATILMRELDFRFAVSRNYQCCSCQNTSIKTELVPIFGEDKLGLSKFHVFDMIAVECKTCGCVQYFDKYFLPEENIWENNA